MAFGPPIVFSYNYRDCGGFVKFFPLFAAGSPPIKSKNQKVQCANPDRAGPEYPERVPAEECQAGGAAGRERQMEIIQKGRKERKDKKYHAWKGFFWYIGIGTNTGDIRNARLA